jgi:hypothetical protein
MRFAYAVANSARLEDISQMRRHICFFFRGLNEPADTFGSSLGTFGECPGAFGFSLDAFPECLDTFAASLRDATISEPAAANLTQMTYAVIMSKFLGKKRQFLFLYRVRLDLCRMGAN